jgi:hypothetical protein
LIAPQIGGFLRPSDAPRVNRVPLRDPSAELLFRIAGLLATTSDLPSATRLIAVEGAGLLPYDKLAFALRLGDGDRMVVVEPGERRPLPGLRRVSVDEMVARVIRGQLPKSFEQEGTATRMIVPLRVAGQIHGALVFGAAPPATLTEQHLNPAQRLADIVAAHLELLRRVAVAEVPHTPVETGRKPMRALPATPPLRAEPA